MFFESLRNRQEKTRLRTYPMTQFRLSAEAFPSFGAINLESTFVDELTSLGFCSAQSCCRFGSTCCWIQTIVDQTTMLITMCPQTGWADSERRVSLYFSGLLCLRCRGMACYRLRLISYRHFHPNHYSISAARNVSSAGAATPTYCSFHRLCDHFHPANYAVIFHRK